MNRRPPLLAAAVVSLGLAAAPAWAAPATGPATKPVAPPVAVPTTGPATTLPALAKDSPSTRPAGATGASPAATTRPVVDVSQVRLELLTGQSVRQMEGKQYGRARQTLLEALAIAPREPTTLYNLACLEALTGHPAEAGERLKQAAENGFDDFAHVAVDTDLNTIRDTAAYKDVMAHQGQYMHRSAERALDGFRKRFGEGYLYEIDDQDKLVFATNTDRRTLDALKRAMTRQARSQWQTLFATHPQEYIAVVVPSTADYDKLRPGPNVQGFYNPGNHTLIASGLGLVTTHEFTHALNFGDVEQLGQRHPIWVAEGLAVLFESSAYKPDPTRGEDVLTPQPNDRLYELLQLKRINRLVSFQRLLKMKQPEFMRRAGPCYAEAGGLMAYLYDRGLLRQWYEAYKAGYDKDPTGRVALEAVLKKPVPEIQKDWEAWLLKQTPPPLFTGVNGAFVGVRFEQANDGLVADNVVADGPAAKAGLHQGDVLVGLDEVEVRDREAFVPLLATHKPGETVTMSVRRGKDYLSVPVVLGTRPPLPADVAARVAADPVFGGAGGATTRPTSQPSAATLAARLKAAAATQPIAKPAG